MDDSERVPIPVGAGTIAGVVAWLVGYAVTYPVGVDPVRADLRSIGLEVLVDGVDDWQLAGWVFYNAHGVEVRLPELGVGFAVTNGNFLAGAGVLSVLYLVPPLAVAVAGAVVTWRYRHAYGGRTDAAIAGATTAVGYLLCTVAGLAVFAVGADGSVIRPDPLTAVVLAGLAYPIAFGSLGGVVASLFAPPGAQRDVE